MVTLIPIVTAPYAEGKISAVGEKDIRSRNVGDTRLWIIVYGSRSLPRGETGKLASVASVASVASAASVASVASADSAYLDSLS